MMRSEDTDVDRAGGDGTAKSETAVRPSDHPTAVRVDTHQRVGYGEERALFTNDEGDHVYPKRVRRG